MEYTAPLSWVPHHCKRYCCLDSSLPLGKAYKARRECTTLHQPLTCHITARPPLKQAPSAGRACGGRRPCPCRRRAASSGRAPCRTASSPALLQPARPSPPLRACRRPSPVPLQAIGCVINISQQPLLAAAAHDHRAMYGGKGKVQSTPCPQAESGLLSN